MEGNFAVRRLVLVYAVLLGDAQDPFRNRSRLLHYSQHRDNRELFVRVDVTEQSPFLVTKMSPYYDR